MSRRRGATLSVLSASRVVSYRLRAARESRGWTQDEAAERLAPFLGVRWSAASFAAAESGAREGGRVRRFSADELLALSRAFDLPLLSFLVPPLGSRIATADTGDEGLDHEVLLDAVFGTPEGREIFEARVLAWASARGDGPDRRTELAPELAASLRDVAGRFGGPGRLAEAAAAVAAALRELDGDVGRGGVDGLAPDG